MSKRYEGTVLEVKGLQTCFFTADGVVKAVDGLSYQVKAGEFVGLVGESGCSKSVSAMSVLRLIPYPPGVIAGGQILFKGEDLLQASEERMRDIRGNRIAMVFQEPTTSLNPVLTVGRGCPFHTRCPHVTDICRREVPRLKKVGDDHLASCHLLDSA